MTLGADIRPLDGSGQPVHVNGASVHAEGAGDSERYAATCSHQLTDREHADILLEDARELRTWARGQVTAARLALESYDAETTNKIALRESELASLRARRFHAGLRHEQHASTLSQDLINECDAALKQEELVAHRVLEERVRGRRPLHEQLLVKLEHELDLGVRMLWIHSLTRAEEARPVRLNTTGLLSVLER